jgi:circadian clock protein KaiC
MAETKHRLTSLLKVETGIQGLDEITFGGLPAGRPTLIAGNAGCGKTLVAMEFLINGITKYGEPGVFVSFEEPQADIIQNVASLGYDLNKLIKQKKLAIDHVQIERHEIDETGEYDLEGLFIRLGYAIDSIGAKRVVLDTIESLFAGFDNAAILRAELRRLFQFLKDKNVTAIITGERGEKTLTRQGLEEYVSDCVILLDHRVEDQISTRRLRVVKYRGSTHGTNEYPFLIDKDGITVMPITSMRLEQQVSSKRISSGIQELDQMLGGGFYKGSNILLSGTAGTGKTSVGAYLSDAACKRGERCLYLAFEESQAQIIRNARSIGIDLDKNVQTGLLKFEAVRSSSHGLETHLANIYKLLEQFKPTVIVVDPITNLITTGNVMEVRAMLGRLMDMLKEKQITALFTSLTQGGNNLEETEYGISSFVDTWLLVRDVETNGERNRLLHVLKSRGTKHSNQVREFVISDDGIKLVDVYVGPEGMLTGSARIAQAARAKADIVSLNEQIAREKRKLERRRNIIETQIASLTADLLTEEEELLTLKDTQTKRAVALESEQVTLRESRGETARSPKSHKP